MTTTVYRPEALYAQGTLHRGRGLVVSAEGRVLETAPADAEQISLPGKLLLPGFVNGHSHAFQRAIRGRTEFLAAGHERDDFWSWREAMYEAATALDPEALYAVSKQAFLEMALAGITTVGEFHYLHHQADGRPYADEHELSRQVIRAARDVGLRICLLRVGYARAGFQVEPNPRQLRFIDADVDTFLRRASELAVAVKGDALVSVGLAPHSVRAVPKAWLEVIGRSWKTGPVHMHVAEQPGEIRACAAEYGVRPVELLEGAGLLNARFTAVHAIHLDRGEIERLGRARATVCACPSTERNLGDGIVEVDALLSAGASVSLGSDSQAHVDLLQEAQQVEGHLRLLRLRRNVLAPGSGDRNSLAARLLDFMTVQGARSLGLSGGSLAPGEAADFVAVDLNHPSVLGSEESALARVVLGAPASAVSDVFVAGRRIVTEGRHVEAETTGRRFLEVVKSLR
ncbi:MAG: formimidoylglutamate deiminase [Archangium sp.]|nr:formimidoylglutamate deiminase [Archangium sp.]